MANMMKRRKMQFKTDLTFFFGPRFFSLILKEKEGGLVMNFEKVFVKLSKLFLKY